MQILRNAQWSAFLAGAVWLSGCIATPDTDTHESTSESALGTTNGLAMINGLSMVNGLTMLNGLTMINGATVSGSILPLNAGGLTKSSFLMNSAAGRSTVAYLVRCALPANHSITKQDSSGASYTFAGQIGVAPEWETGQCSVTGCQEQVTACMLAHVNTSGVHIPLWLDGDSPAISWGQSSSYPDQEGSFFGNIFVSPPVAFYCNGKDFDVGVVPGRIGAGLGNAPYKNPFSSPGYCKDHCTAADIPHSADGYKACNGYNHIVTVWRNPSGTTTTGTGGASSSSGSGGRSGSGSGSSSGSGSRSGSGSSSGSGNGSGNHH